MDAVSKMNQVQKALDDYERGLGLLHTNPIDEAEINGYFTMARNDIESLSAFDCVAIAVRLNQMAFYIQKNHNNEASRFSWAEAEINKYSANKLDSVGGQYAKHETKIYLLAEQDEYLSKLVAIKNYAKQRLDRLSYLASSIKSLSDSFSSVSKTKLALREKN